MKNITFAERLKEARKSAKLSQDALAKKIGRTKSTISRWESGERNPKMFEMVELENALGISAETLMYGTSEIKTTTLSEINRVSSELHPHRQEKVLDFAQAELTDQNKENTIKLFPYNVQEKLSAGTGYDYDGNGSYDVAYSDKEIDYDFASWVFGDSMLPDYPNGDVALIKVCPFDYDGDVYAVDWDGQSYIKKVYKESDGLRLVSTNEKYADKFAAFSEEPRIIGKVVGSFTPIEK
ncbi:helix-turn-helix domain-containing protein [Lactococcus raffinolactis]|uniref:Helix-turn-helix domain-containing protein n=1 Tax=Pseudolactococcus raffinolactis TaxID=1366 RepID=A0AAE6YKW5_9LACT|nr:helix-turn-helix domain-containing protein [Lactococcus raffinolactis]